jgi:hopanoid biosynthesis associated RND transporter like protein HpnN
LLLFLKKKTCLRFGTTPARRRWDHSLHVPETIRSTMAPSFLTRLTGFCVRFAWAVILPVAVMAAAAGFYAAQHFAITTDTDRLMPPSLPWVMREHAYQAIFPPKRIVAVVQAPTQELAGDAATRLADWLRAHHNDIKAVEQPQGGSFVARSALLFQSPARLQKLTGDLIQARPLLAQLAADPSLRGIMQALAEEAPLAQHAERPASLLAATLEESFAGTFASFSWLSMLQGHDPSAADLRQLLPMEPVLNYHALQPGSAATQTIRQGALRTEIAARDGATVRLTGEAPENDEQFATLSNGAALNGAATALAVLLILFLALRSGRLVFAVALNLVAGLAITAAIGLLMEGAFNLISVAFAVLFVGLGADFGIQFGVRYRAENYDMADTPTALRSAAAKAGGALALAAAGVAAGFFSFLPTDYRGVSELGQIAGTGMLIAFVLTLTFLPALISRLRPSGEKEPLGYRFLAPVDGFLARHRIAVVVCTLGAVLAGTPLLASLKFDFDPMHLQDPNGEAVRTYRELGRDPATGVAAVDAATPSLAAARDLARRLDSLPQVQSTRTVDLLVPTGQAQKMAIIAEAARTLLPAIDPPSQRAAPTDAETVAAIRQAAAALPPRSTYDRLRGLLLRLAAGDHTLRDTMEAAMVVPLKLDLDQLRAMLRPEWLKANGMARVQILPRGNPDDSATLAAFARAVLGVAPQASGMAITLLESRDTVLRAFIQAGICAVLAIAVILFIALRRVTDVLLTLVPLLVAGAVTLEITVLTGQKLNFANIIALPLLLGVGVAFKIYYILAWRRGATNLLQSALTRAVFFSALTTMTAFGSLWLSNEPGMSSMGKLMALALVCTLAAAVLFQPALMGPPREK